MYVAGKKRRLTLIECGNDLNTMIDIAKVADLVRIYMFSVKLKGSSGSIVHIDIEHINP